MQPNASRALDAEAEITSLRDGIHRNHDNFYDLGFKVTAALAVALGWFAVQENPLPQLCSAFRYGFEASVVVLVACWLAVAAVFCVRYQNSRKTAAALHALGVPAQVYAPDLISRPVLALGIVFQLIIFTCLGMSIGMVYQGGYDSAPCQLMKTEKLARMAVAKAKLSGDTKISCKPGDE
jgi:hypothetical protein